MLSAACRQPDRAPRTGHPGPIDSLRRVGIPSLAENQLMLPARLLLIVGTIGALGLAGMLSAQQSKPAAPMQIAKVKAGV